MAVRPDLALNRTVSGGRPSAPAGKAGYLARYAPHSGRSIIAAAGLEDMVMPGSDGIVHRNPHILGGTPVFVGTRVPVKILFDYLEAGDSLDVFLDEFPTVTREQAIAALELAREVVAPDAHPA